MYLSFNLLYFRSSPFQNIAYMPKELTLSLINLTTELRVFISLFKNLISLTHPRHHPLKELVGRYVVHQLFWSEVFRFTVSRNTYDNVFYLT